MAFLDPILIQDNLLLKGNKMLKSIVKSAVILLAFTAQAFACQLADTRVCEIDAQLKLATGGHTVQYAENSSSGAAEYEWVLGQPDIIHLGDTKLLEDDQLYFVIAHEFAHSQLRHGRKLVEHFAPETARALTDLELFQQYGHAAKSNESPETLNHLQEFEADAFAAKMLNKSGINFAKTMRSFLRSTGGSHLHPAKNARIEQAKKAVEFALNS